MGGPDEIAPADVGGPWGPIQSNLLVCLWIALLFWVHAGYRATSAASGLDRAAAGPRSGSGLCDTYDPRGLHDRGFLCLSLNASGGRRRILHAAAHFGNSGT